MWWDVAALGIVLVASAVLPPTSATETKAGRCRRPPEAGGRRLRRGWLAGHPRRRQCCYWDELTLVRWAAVVDWSAGGAPLPLPLPLALAPPLALALALPNE